jgi:hypothetical protein
MNYQETVNIIKNNNGTSGRMYNEKYLKNNYFEIYTEVISYCNDRLIDIPFKEKIYHYVHDIKDKILCKHPDCNNETKYHNSTLGYYDYCSIQCISGDPRIKEIKEKKSYEKFGTKAPGMNNEIKQKTIKTNNERYGGNSPLNNKEIVEKSLKSFRETKINKNLDKYKAYKNISLVEVDYDNHVFKFYCNKGHEFDIDMYSFRNRKKIDTEICTICNPINSFTNSGQELQLREYIQKFYDKEILYNDRNVIGKEIDIYLPDLKLGFEFNGVYWHNELYKSNNFHLEKTELSEKFNIKLIHVYQDDWIYKQDIVKSRILNLLGKTSNKIYGRKCIIKEINDNKIVRDFLDKNHLQGFIGGQIKLGLFYNNELMSLMTFGRQRKSMGTKSKEDSYEMLRFCNKLNTSVIGAASKLFKYFVDIYNPVEIVSYADRSWSQGELYKQLGFDLVHKTKPNYYYIIDGIRKYRFLFRKDLLIKQGYDPNKTEREIMLERKIYRIYDSGSMKFIYTKKHI